MGLETWRRTGEPAQSNTSIAVAAVAVRRSADYAVHTGRPAVLNSPDPRCAVAQATRRVANSISQTKWQAAAKLRRVLQPNRAPLALYIDSSTAPLDKFSKQITRIEL